MAALAYRDDKILARNLLSHPFFCLTPAEPFFRPDRSSTAPSCRVAVKDGRAFRGHPKGLSLTAARTMARWRSRVEHMRGSEAYLVTPAIVAASRFPFPRLYRSPGTPNREVHRLSRFRDHRTAWSCLRASESCLHCEINDLVQEHVEGHETVDIAEVAARMAESLVDLVLRAPEEQQAQLLAATISYVGQAFLEKTGAIAGEGNTVQ